MACKHLSLAPPNTHFLNLLKLKVQMISIAHRLHYFHMQLIRAVRSTNLNDVQPCMYLFWQRMQIRPRSHGNAIVPFHLRSSFWNAKRDCSLGNGTIARLRIGFVSVHTGMQSFRSTVFSLVLAIFSNNNNIHACA